MPCQAPQEMCKHTLAHGRALTHTHTQTHVGWSPTTGKRMSGTSRGQVWDMRFRPLHFKKSPGIHLEVPDMVSTRRRRPTKHGLQGAEPEARLARRDVLLRRGEGGRRKGGSGAGGHPKLGFEKQSSTSRSYISQMLPLNNSPLVLPPSIAERACKSE